jgi:hypothetical protein
MPVQGLQDAAFLTYRLEIVLQIIAHYFMAVAVVLAMVWLKVKAVELRSPQLEVWVVALTVSLLGIIVHLEVVIKRMGLFLAQHGDPWENALARTNAFLTPVADIILLTVVVAMFVHSLVQVYRNKVGGKRFSLWFCILTPVAVLVAIGFWILAGTIVRRGL